MEWKRVRNWLILLVLASIYAVGIVCTYVQGRLMMTVSQNAVEKLRNDLYGMVREIHAGRYPFNNFLY